MKLTLKRSAVGTKETRGTLFLNGEFYATTCEPGKEWARGPIPCGTYEVRVTYSPRFKKPLPLLLNVPDFEGIRIHGGTRAEHTLGCICIPLNKMYSLTEKISYCNRTHEKVTIDIVPAAGDHS